MQLGRVGDGAGADDGVRYFGADTAHTFERGRGAQRNFQHANAASQQRFGQRDGLFDLVSLRFIQNSEAEPSLQGIDLVGLYADYDTARRVVLAGYDGKRAITVDWLTGRVVVSPVP